ncbi:MAG TPA: chorismate-binding protein [Candidatus Saccharimonadales bacterium]|nr:chorismate-binding protein [Candidatus Saccharimonadales bacterium]
MKLQLQPTNLSTDPFAVFRNLVGKYDNCFLLETLGTSPGPSYIGVDPKRVYSSEDSSFYDLKSSFTTNPQTQPGYVGGLVGYTSHEAIQQWEPSLGFRYPRQFHDFQFGEYQDGLIFRPGKAPDYFHYGRSQLKKYQLQKSKTKRLQIRFDSAQKDQAMYEAMINKAKADIQAGRVFQVVLANRYEYGFDGDLVTLYEQLREVNPSEYMFFIKFGKTIVLGASPELLIHVTPGRKVSLEALAGTIKRGTDALSDERLGNQLKTDEKELAEHSMLVDLARNDVGRVSKIGSVKIDDLMYIKKLSHVQHLCSLIIGELADGEDMFSALAAAAPAGTLTGTPKIEATKMIAELEGTERGPYGGTIGYFSYGGDSVHAVNIRSISAHNNRLTMHSGSGIVYDSQAANEYEEVARKKAAMDEAMKPFLESQL